MLWWAVAVALAAGFLLYAVGRKRRADRLAPAWTDPHQPPAGLAGELATVSPQMSRAVNGCPSINAASVGRTAGRRLHRTYPPSLLAADPSYSLIGQASITLGD
jgi:hypothetical protein